MDGTSRKSKIIGHSTGGPLIDVTFPQEPLKRLPQDTLNSATKTFGIVLVLFGLLEVGRSLLSLSGPSLIMPFRQVILSNHTMSALLGTYIAYLLLPEKRSWKVVVTVVGLGLEGLLFQERIGSRGLLGTLLLTGLGPGLASFVAMLLRAALSPPVRKWLLQYAVISILTPFLLLASAFFHTWNTILNPAVYDVYSYCLDSVWGFSPPFVVNRLCYQLYIPIGFLSETIYWELALWMVLSVIAGLYYPKHRSYNEGFLTLLAIGVVGALLYGFFPSTGVDDLFGGKFRDPASFYGYHPNPSELTLRLINAPLSIHRNAMPSLHAGWIFVVFLNLRLMPRKLYLAGGLLTVFTLLGALEMGHYFIDFLPSLLLALGSAALTARPGTLDKAWRFGASLICFGGAVAYLALLRAFSVQLIESPLLNILSQVAVLGLAVLMDQLLLRHFLQKKSGEPESK